MSVEVKVRLRGYVKAEEILNYLVQKIDPKATMSPISKCEKTKENCDLYSEFTIFTFMTDKNVSMSYYYTNDNDENYEYWVEKGLKDMVDTANTRLSMYCNNYNINLMKNLVAEFGGWIDEKDSDDEYFYPVEKNSDGSIKPIFYVTMEDIYEKFGGIVIIK